MGWREWVALPDLGIDTIKAKVDTGARSSSLHALHIERFRRRRRDWVRFGVHPLQRSVEPLIQVEAQLHDVRHVRSSNGVAAERPVIVTRVVWNEDSWPVELTLASRDAMGFRMLLGRQAVRGRCLVDAGNSYYGPQPRTTRRRK
mgnify:CR=1 FL=1